MLFAVPPRCIRKTTRCACASFADANVFCSLGGGSCFAGNNKTEQLSFAVPPRCIRKTTRCACASFADANVFCSLGGGSCFAGNLLFTASPHCIRKIMRFTHGPSAAQMYFAHWVEVPASQVETKHVACVLRASTTPQAACSVEAVNSNCCQKIDIVWKLGYSITD